MYMMSILIKWKRQFFFRQVPRSNLSFVTFVNSSICRQKMGNISKLAAISFISLYISIIHDYLLTFLYAKLNCVGERASLYVTRLNRPRMSVRPSSILLSFCSSAIVQGGREVTVHTDNRHLRLNLSLHSTAQHVVQCKMVGWQQCPR
jgi:hypothetical protein